jgi:hypothetical protein
VLLCAMPVLSSATCHQTYIEKPNLCQHLLQLCSGQNLSLVLHTPQPRQKVVPGSGCGTFSRQRHAPGQVWLHCSGWSWHLLHMCVVPQQNQDATWQQYLHSNTSTQPRHCWPTDKTPTMNFIATGVTLDD